MRIFLNPLVLLVFLSSTTYCSGGHPILFLWLLIPNEHGLSYSNEPYYRFGWDHDINLNSSKDSSVSHNLVGSFSRIEKNYIGSLGYRANYKYITGSTKIGISTQIPIINEVGVQLGGDTFSSGLSVVYENKTSIYGEEPMVHSVLFKMHYF